MDYRIVDVFAESPLAGNPLAVCLADDLSAATMQAVARETNLSETTFVGSPAEDGSWPVRIFTPRQELPFAGHPTLGTAWVLRGLHAPGAATLTLRLAVGDVPVAFSDDGIAWLDAPDVSLGREVPAERAAKALGIDVDDVDPEYPTQVVSVGPASTYVPLRSRDALQRASCPAERAEGLVAEGAEGAVYAFTRETEEPGNQVQSRLFAPLAGIVEDPATGSAAACLGEYVRSHAYLGETPEVFQIEQGLEIQRPSLLRVRTRPGIQVGGRVQPVAEGVWQALPPT